MSTVSAHAAALRAIDSVAPSSLISPVNRARRNTPPPPIETNRSITSPTRGGAGQEVLECDYDVNPTYLYQAIEAREWSAAKGMFHNNNKNSDIAATETATWVTRKETDGRLRWRLLPIHAAILFQSPLDLIELLLTEYPAGAQCKDDQGMLPLHLAFRCGSEWDILEELMTANPQAIAVKDRKGRTPIQCASSSTKKQASVLELYTQIAVSSERQRAVNESRTVLEGRVAELQQSHITSLTSLKDECQTRIQQLESALQEKQQEFEETLDELEVTKQKLNSATRNEMELTSKLTEVSSALSAMSELRAAEESLAAKKQTHSNAKLLEINDELIMLVQKLLNQQASLKVSLDKQALEKREQSRRRTDELLATLQQYTERIDSESNKERDEWRNKLDTSQSEVTRRLATLRKESQQTRDAVAEKE